MSILIICDQIDCMFNNQGTVQKGLVENLCTHPRPELSYNIRQNADRNCLSKSVQCDDSKGTDMPEDTDSKQTIREIIQDNDE